MARRSGALRFKLLLGFLLVAIVAWSVLWFLAATVVDRQLERAELMAGDQGAQFECAGRDVSGYPFRLTVRCGEGSRAGSNDYLLTFNDVVLAAPVFQPNHIIAELPGPVTYTSPMGPETRAEWDLARASARLSLRDPALERLDAEVTNGRVSIGSEAPIAAELMNLNVRRDPDEPTNLGVAVRITNATVEGVSAPTTVTARLLLEGAAVVLDGPPNRLQALIHAEGLPVVIEEAQIESGDLVLRASGTLILEPDGLIDGRLDLALAGYDGDMPQVDMVPPEIIEAVSTLLDSALTFAPPTDIAGRPARALTLQIEESNVRAGFVPLMSLPRVNLGAL